MIAAFIPYSAVVNSAPFICFNEDVHYKTQCCLLANLNSYPFDFIARQKVGGLHLNYFIIEQLPMFTPDFYEDACPWRENETLADWISERVLKLSCTSNDMVPLAEAAGFTGNVHKWESAERSKLMAELDAAFFILYGIKRDDVEYILSTFSGLKKDNESLMDNTTTTSLILKYYDQFCA